MPSGGLGAAEGPGLAPGRPVWTLLLLVWWQERGGEGGSEGLPTEPIEVDVPDMAALLHHSWSHLKQPRDSLLERRHTELALSSSPHCLREGVFFYHFLVQITTVPKIVFHPRAGRWQLPLPTPCFLRLCHTPPNSFCPCPQVVFPRGQTHPGGCQMRAGPPSPGLLSSGMIPSACASCLVTWDSPRMLGARG